MNTVKNSLIAVTLLLGVQTSLKAYRGYEPRVDGQAIVKLPCTINRIGDDKQSITGAGAIVCGESKIGADFEYDKDTFRLDVKLSGNLSQFSLPRGWMEPSTVSSSDYNDDGIQDLMIVAWGGGVGLAGLYIEVMFVLSTADGYEVSSIDTMDPAEVFKSQSGVTKFIHKDTVSAITDFDGKWHTFWVYRFYGFEGTKLIPLADEPVWIMFTNKPNRQATSKLSIAQKKSALAENEKIKGPIQIRSFKPLKKLP